MLRTTGLGLPVPLGQLTVSAFDQPPQLREWAERRCPGPITMDDLGAAPGYTTSLPAVGRAVTVTERDATTLLQRPD